MKLLVPMCAVAATAAVLAASSPAAAQPTRSGACFRTRNVTGFHSPDDRTVYVRTSPGRDVWELKLFTPCRDINWPGRIALDARPSGMICEGRVNVQLHASGRRGIGPRRCSVTDVRRLTPDEVAAIPPGARP